MKKNNLKGLARPVLIDFFCGVGGWSKAFMARGWTCIGVDITAMGYPGLFWNMDALHVSRDVINSADAIVSSPPCEEFARAWLPWLRGDHKPKQWAINLLQWSVDMCKDKSNRITECSVFAGRSVGGGQRHGSYVLWGDIPLLMPRLPRGKMAKSGMKPELRAEIPPALAEWIADYYTRNYRKSNEI